MHTTAGESLSPLLTLPLLPPPLPPPSMAATLSADGCTATPNDTDYIQLVVYTGNTVHPYFYLLLHLQ